MYHLARGPGIGPQEGERAEDEEPAEELQDIELVCVEEDCGATFTWSAGEQGFFKANGLYQPRRCQPCRRWRRFENNYSHLSDKIDANNPAR